LEPVKKILVVDDEPYALSILERLLKKEGYSVQLANCGSEALKSFPRFKPDLVLLDLMMPGMNGEEVCREIRKISWDTKVVYFSAKQFVDAHGNFSEPDCAPDGFIAKPASGKIILSTVRKVLNGKQMKAKD
jgi:two-component system response regulator MtrA